MNIRRLKGNKKLLFGIGIIILISILIFGVNLKFVSSRTNADSSIAMSTTGNWSGVNYNEDLYLYLEGENAIKNRMKGLLVTELEKEGFEVVLIDDLLDSYDKQVLAVQVEKRKGNYNPIAINSNTRTIFAYSSQGSAKVFKELVENSKYSEDLPLIDFSGENTVGMSMAGWIEIKDSTKGFITYKGFKTLIAENSSQELINRFKHQVENLN